MDEKQIADLEAKIKEAQERLATAPDKDKPALETQIADGRKALATLQEQHESQYRTMEHELEELRREKRDRETQEAARDIANTIAHGVKAAEEAEKARMATLIQQEIKKVIGDLPPSAGLKGLIADALPDVLGQVRTGRKTPYEAQEAEAAPRRGETRVDGMPAYVRSTGEKATVFSFFRAVGQQDRAAIRDMQHAAGVALGTKHYTAMNGYGSYSGWGEKALVEGGGYIDAVAGPSGGYVVPVQYVNELIPLLYPYTTVLRAGATVIPMRSPNLRQGSLTGGATASYVGETAQIPVSQETFGQFSLTAKELVCMVPVSRFLVQDSDPAVEAIVRNDMARAYGLKQDISFLTGAGGATVPQGILTASGTQQISPATNGDAPTFAMVVQMRTKLRKANVPIIKPAWFGPPDIQDALARVSDNNGRPIFQDFMNPQNITVFNNGSGTTMTPNAPDGVLMGIPFYSSTQIPLGTTGSGATAPLALVEMSQVGVGQLGDMEVDASDVASYKDGNGNIISAWQTAQTVFRLIGRHDISMFHSQAVVVHNGVIYT